jgi:hypothetical protein
MDDVDVSPPLYDRYDRLASELSGFEDADELIAYVLNEVANEIERDVGGEFNEALDEEEVEQRLEDLGYM